MGALLKAAHLFSGFSGKEKNAKKIDLSWGNERSFGELIKYQ